MARLNRPACSGEEDDIGDALDAIRKQFTRNGVQALDSYRQLWQAHCSRDGVSCVPVETHSSHEQTATMLQRQFDSLYTDKATANKDVRSQIHFLRTSAWAQELGGLRLYVFFGQCGCSSRDFLKGLRGFAEMRACAHNKDSHETDSHETDSHARESKDLSFMQAYTYLLRASAQRREGKAQRIKQDSEWRPADVRQAIDLASADLNLVVPEKEERTQRRTRTRTPGESGEGTHTQASKNSAENDASASPEQRVGAQSEPTCDKHGNQRRESKGDSDGQPEDASKDCCNERDNEDVGEDDIVCTSQMSVRSAPTPERGRDNRHALPDFSSSPNGFVDDSEPFVLDDFSRAARGSREDDGEEDEVVEDFDFDFNGSSQVEMWDGSTAPPHRTCTFREQAKAAPPLLACQDQNKEAGNHRFDFDTQQPQPQLPSTPHIGFAAPTSTQNTMGLRDKRAASPPPDSRNGMVSLFKRARLDAGHGIASSSLTSGQAAIEERLDIAAQFLSVFCPQPAVRTNTSVSVHSDAADAFSIVIVPPAVDTSENPRAAAWHVAYAQAGTQCGTLLRIYTTIDDGADTTTPDRVRTILAQALASNAPTSACHLSLPNCRVRPLPKGCDMRDVDAGGFVRCVAVATYHIFDFLEHDNDLPPTMFIWAWIGTMAKVCGDAKPRVSEISRAVEMPELPALSDQTGRDGNGVPEVLGKMREELQSLKRRLVAVAAYKGEMELIRRCVSPALAAKKQSQPMPVSAEESIKACQKLLDHVQPGTDLYLQTQRHMNSLLEREAESLGKPAQRKLLEELAAWTTLNITEADNVMSEDGVRRRLIGERARQQMQAFEELARDAEAEAEA